MSRRCLKVFVKNVLRIASLKMSVAVGKIFGPRLSPKSFLSWGAPGSPSFGPKVAAFAQT